MMLYKLTAFEKHELALSSLIGDLEGLFDALDLQDEYWREGFWDSWGDLEVVYALALDMPSKPLSDSSIQHVWEAVAKLKSLIATKLQQV